MQIGRAVLVLLLGLVLGLVLAVGGVAPAHAGEPTTLRLAGDAAYAGADTVLRLDLTAASGPVGGAVVTVERRGEGAWRPVATLTTDAAGHAEVVVRLVKEAADNEFRATYAGQEPAYAAASAQTPVGLLQRASRLRLRAPAEVVDERSATLTVVWRADDGQPVRGEVQVQGRGEGGRWRTVATVRTDDQGRAQLAVQPRVDTAYRARAAGLDWVRGDTSPVRRVDNLPPRPRVQLPRGAPGPRVRVPRQARAVGEGANVVIGAIPDGVWSSMVGRSWHAGCPVGRSGLRLVRVNYWGYDGYRYRGELVAATGAAGQMAGALAEMYRRGFPIRSMYRVDRFGWSRRLQGADDYASMAAGNTSAFNCRHVVGRPGVRSPHSYGRSLDVNTWENPYYSARGVVPNAYWGRRSHPLVAWRSRSHPVVGIMARHGLRWTYGTGDSQHFDARGHGGPVPRGRVAHPGRLHPQCGDDACK